jgi:hypothetical protein
MTARCRAHAGKFTSARMAADTFALYARLVAGGPVLSA